MYIYIYLKYLYIYIEKKNATFCVLLCSFTFFAKECCVLLHSEEKNAKELIILLGLISCQKLEKRMLRSLKERKRTMCLERKITRCPTLLFWDLKSKILMAKQGLGKPLKSPKKA